MAVIVIAGNPAWTETIEARLGADWRAIRYTERVGYIGRLADDHAAMILADGDGADWRFWTTTPKTSPATRRIPIVLVAENPDARGAALTAGADFAYAPDELLVELGDLLRDFARVPDPAQIEQLECECNVPLPAIGLEGIKKFNAGEYYRQHDLFESLWVQTKGPVRDLYRAILQVGVAYYQIERGNHRGALKMLLRSVQWLAILPDVCQGVDVAQLRADSYRVRAELERMNPANIAQFDKTILKPVKLVKP